MSAVRYQNDPHTKGRVPGYYANNKLYKDAYARTDWQTRTSRRVHDGLSLQMNYGLDTVSDDVNSSPYSSPYYVNGRYNSDNLVTQRGNSASVQGIKRLAAAAPETRVDFAKDDMQTTIKMWQGKQIKFELPYQGKVVGNTLMLRNTEGCTGILSIYISNKEDGLPIYETAIDLCDISEDFFDKVDLYAMTPIKRDANPRGILYVRMEIWDEVSLERSANPFNTGRKIEIAATGLGNHQECIYKLGDKNVPAKEEYNYSPQPSRPLMGLIYSDWESVPTERHEDSDYGAYVTLNGARYDLFTITNGLETKMVVYDYQLERMVDESTVDLPVDARATSVNVVQAVDEVFYVDGYSTVQHFKIGEWQATPFTAAPLEDTTVSVDLATWQESPLAGNSGTYLFIYDGTNWKVGQQSVNLSDYGITIQGDYIKGGVITVTYTAATSSTQASISATYYDGRPVIAPSIICKHNNRIYLGGFRNDPNLVQISQITEEGPDYFNFPYRFYVPDNAPQSTSTNTVTAIVEAGSDSLMIISKNSYSIFSTNGTGVTLEDSIPTQTSTYIDGAGVRTPGDITNYQGVIYSFDPDEGIRRFSGATWNAIPSSVKSLTDRVDMKKPRKLWGYANKLYFNYTDAVDGRPKCLIWDKDMNYQQYPWFQDVDIPFCDVRHDDDFDIIGIHPDYPCIMKLYAQDTWRRMDTPITFERHTKYVSLPGNASNMIVNRVHNKVLANSNRWWWFSLSADENELTQHRGNDAWYRMPVWDTLTVQKPAEDPFPYQDTYEEKAVALLTISNVRIRAISIQEKIKCRTFRSQANLISTLFETRVRQYN